MQDFTHRHVYLSGGRDTEMEMTSLCLFYLSDINECDSDPCQNNGHCNNMPGSYQCACPSGYLGTNCQSGKFKSPSQPIFVMPHNVPRVRV